MLIKLRRLFIAALIIFTVPLRTPGVTLYKLRLLIFLSALRISVFRGRALIV